VDVSDLEVVKEFDDGFFIVRLTTPEKLDEESHKMGHCVGDGAYDKHLEKDEVQIFSLRDPNNNPHATMEVRQDKNGSKVLYQCKGKQDKTPVRKYMPYIKKYVQQNEIRLTQSPKSTGLIQLGGQMLPYYYLPEGFVHDGDLDYTGRNDFELPKNLTVKGTLDLSGTGVQNIPFGLKVDKLIAKNTEKLSDLPAIEVKEEINLTGSGVEWISRRVKTRRLILSDTSKLDHLPAVKAEEEIDLNLSNVKTISGVETGRLNLSNTRKLRHLPGGVKAEKGIIMWASKVETIGCGIETPFLDLFYTKNLEHLPPIKAEKWINLDDSGIKTIGKVETESLNLTNTSDLRNLSAVNVKKINLKGSGIETMDDGLQAKELVGLETTPYYCRTFIENSEYVTVVKPAPTTADAQDKNRQYALVAA
jgi:hypothetical protein